MRREPVRPSERRSESAAGECVWAAAIFYWERLRVMAVGAELTVARSYGADVGGALCPQRIPLRHERAKRAAYIH